MNREPIVSIRLGRRSLALAAISLLLAALALLLPGRAAAQKTQENFKEKFAIAEENGGVGIATSSDGKYVYVVGPRGIMVSDDYGKTGSWIQTVRLK